MNGRHVHARRKMRSQRTVRGIARSRHFAHVPPVCVARPVEPTASGEPAPSASPLARHANDASVICFAPPVIERVLHGTPGTEALQPLGALVQSIGRDLGCARLLLRLNGFDGWSSDDPWQRVDVHERQFDALERVAIVGDPRFQAGAVAFCQPFTRAERRYFPADAAQAAEAWVRAARRGKRRPQATRPRGLAATPK